MKFVNLDKRFEKGMADFLKFHKFDYDLEIKITGTEENKLIINKDKNNVEFILHKPYMVYRAITLLKEQIKKDSFSLTETCYFKSGGPMFDGSQSNSLMNLKSAKKMMLISAGMGFNTFMLYCEDSYEIDGENYFGNMRSRYSKDELKELDSYADSLGLELIPCIQTLGHLTDAIKKQPYKQISDTGSVLLVGEEKTYELIEKMIKTASECFKSRRIHIGLDEAFDLGLGNYLSKNGYTKKTEIMKAHLQRLDIIVKKYGFTPMMWADMFFRAKSKTNGYHDDINIEFDEEDKKSVPENMGLIHWDYYNYEVSQYELFFKKLQKLSDNVIFAGCARNVRTFGAHYNKGVMTTNPGMTAAKNTFVNEFIATVWGDNHRESSTFAVLPQIQWFAEHMYSKDPTEERVKERFNFSTDLDWDSIMDINSLDEIPGYNDKNTDNLSVTRGIMWQNILLGLLDYNLRDFDFSKHYEKLSEKFEKSAKNIPKYRPIFEFYKKLADVLKVKSSIGIKLYDAYKTKDTKQLKKLRSILKKLLADTEKLRLAHQNYFYYEYKPIGWEVLDIRYGGAIMGIKTAIKRVSDYLDNKIDKIEELEEERLNFRDTKIIPQNLNYQDICSASRV